MEKENEDISLKSLIVYYLKHWRAFLVAGIVAVIFAILYIVIYPKTYEVMSVLKIQDEKDLTSGGGISMGDAAGLMRSFGIGGGSSASINVDDEIATLQSNSLISKVVRKLGMDVTCKSPFSLIRLYDESPIIISPDSAFRANINDFIEFQMTINKKGIRIKMDKTNDVFTFKELPIKLHLDEGFLDLQYREDMRSPESLKLNISISPVSWVAEDIASLMTVEEYSKMSNTIELQYTDHNKKRGKDFMNSLLYEYNNQASSVRKKDGFKSLNFLKNRINTIVLQLKEAEREIEVYKLKNKMTDIEHDVLLYTEALKIYREKLIELETQQYMVNLLEEYVKDPSNKNKLVPAALVSGAKEGEQNSPVLSYNQALLMREKTLKSSKKSSPIAEIEASQIDKLREGVLVSVGNTKISLDKMMNELRGQEKAILDKMGYVPTYEREYIDLKRKQEILQGIYLVLLQKEEEVALAIEGGRDKGFITDEAFVKQKQVAPRMLFALIFVFIFTLVIPVVYLFMNNRIKELSEAIKNS